MDAKGENMKRKIANADFHLNDGKKVKSLFSTLFIPFIHVFKPYSEIMSNPFHCYFTIVVIPHP